MYRKAVIFGIKGKTLTAGEKYILKNKKPWGIILFSRNIKNLFQLKLLIDDIRKVVKDLNYPILIDQEGGRVSRLNKIVDLSLFTQNYFARLYVADKKNFFYKYKLYTNTVCHILNSVGININTVPVLDVKRKNSHKVIGDRSFSVNPEIVSKLGKICIELHERNKIFTVIKHIPGHGLSKYDSHKTLPTIKSKKNELIKKMGQKKLIVELQSPINSIPSVLQQYNLDLSTDGSKLSYTYDAKRQKTGITSLLQSLRKNKIRLKDLKTEQSSLENIFVNLVKEKKT